ncbi:MAG: hypothetical protein WC282_02390, partial [Bacilli bacterium]
TYWNGSTNVTLATCLNQAGSDERFVFAFDLRLLVESGNYYDIVLSIDGVKSDMTTDMAINIARTIAYEGRQYYFRSWEGLLKIVFSNGG